MSLQRVAIAVVFLETLAVAPKAPAAEPTRADLYVAPNGNDAWSGRLAQPKSDGRDGPLATLAAARDAVRRLKAKAPARPVRVLLRGGAYRIGNAIVFTAEDSGTREAPITYAAYPGEKPVLSGGVPITGWNRADGGLWRAIVPEVKRGEWYFRQLFVAGRRCIPARIPNRGEVYHPAGPIEPLRDRNAARRDPKTRMGFRYRNEDLKRWSSLEDVIAVVYHSWTTSRHHVQSLEPEKRIVRFSNPSSWPMYWWGENERYYVECVREGLDAPGEWHLDRASGVLTYYSRPGEDMGKAETIAPRTEELLRLEGDPSAGKLVEHLHFEGLSLQHTEWVMPRQGAVDGQAAAFLKTAAVFARGARDCVFERCEIVHTGGYGLWLERGCKACRLVQCHLHDLGAGGVRLGETSLPEEPQEQAERNEVYNCFIHDGGNVYHAGVGVWIGRSSHNEVHHNEICDFYYTGVSVGWSWGYAPSSAHHNAIEYNHIHHLGWGELSDMGGIYTLGVSPGTRLRYNLIHDVLSYSYGGWGLYTDEGSTHILLENNVVYRVKDGAFHQHYGRENTVRNNVLAFSATYGQIRRSRQEEHSSFTIERNVICGNAVPMLGGNWSNGNFTLRANCYWDTSGRAPEFPDKLHLRAWQQQGHDQDSIVADPRFVDPEHYDLRLQADSPALKLGFRPIDTGAIGLVGPPEWVELPKRTQRPRMVLPGES